MSIRTRTGEIQVDLDGLSAATHAYLYGYGLQQAGNDRVAGEPDPTAKLDGIRAFVVKLADPNFQPRMRVGGGGDGTFTVAAGRQLLIDWKARKSADIDRVLKGLSGTARVAEIEALVAFHVRKKYAAALGVDEKNLESHADYDEDRLAAGFTRHWDAVEAAAEKLREAAAAKRAATKTPTAIEV